LQYIHRKEKNQIGDADENGQQTLTLGLRPSVVYTIATDWFIGGCLKLVLNVQSDSLIIILVSNNL